MFGFVYYVLKSMNYMLLDLVGIKIIHV